MGEVTKGVTMNTETRSQISHLLLTKVLKYKGQWTNIQFEKTGGRKKALGIDGIGVVPDKSVGYPSDELKVMVF